jgi:acetoin utilization protein AcuB
MYVRDIMTTNVVTIPSSTSIADAKRIMTAHRIERLPVVDKGKLVGIVTARRLEQVSPSKATSLTVWELSYLLDRTTVKEIMEKDVVTATPDMTVEEALAIGQGNKVGSLVVLEDNRVVGIVTTNDFFYKVANPILGLGKPGVLLPGTRIEITGGGEEKAIEEIISTINKLDLKINTLHTHAMSPEEPTKKDFIIHLESEDVGQLISELKNKGYSVAVRKR